MKLSSFKIAGTASLALFCLTCSVLASTPCDKDIDIWAKWCTTNGKPDGPFNDNVCQDAMCKIFVTEDAYLLLSNNHKTDTICFPYMPNGQQVAWIDSKGGLATFDVNFGQSGPFVDKTEFSGHILSHQDGDKLSDDALGCYAFSVEHCVAVFIGCKKNDPRVIVQGMGFAGSAVPRKKPH